MPKAEKRSLTAFLGALSLLAMRRKAQAGPGFVSDYSTNERELHRKFMELETVLELAPIGIAIAEDAQCRRVRGNAALQRLFGLPAHRLFSSAGSLPAEYCIRREGRQIAREEFPLNVAAARGIEVFNVELDLGTKQICGNAAPLFDEHGGSRGAIGAFWDISELKQAKRELEEADRRKDSFLATLAHELRNPLAPIRSALQLMKVCGNRPDLLVEAREVAERQMTCLVRLVDDLLDISRVGRGKITLQKRKLDVREVMRTALETTRPHFEIEKHQLVAYYTERPLWVSADQVRLGQALSNLLINAAKYTNAGGQIHFSVRAEEGRAVIEVTDNGIGIEPELLPHVFQMYTQVEDVKKRSRGGLGIGLALTKSLVELHGGTIDAESPGRGQGSVFRIRLPLLQLAQDEETQENAGRSDRYERRREKVLVVDDNADAAQLLSLLLESLGHESEVAFSGNEAVEKAKIFRPSAVLLDIGMPDLDGYEVARQLKSTDEAKEAMLVAVTGWAGEDDRRSSAEAGFDAHLIKPVDVDALQNVFALFRNPR